MIEDLEDFKAYLKGNCREDYDRITSPDIKEDAVNAIKSRHERKYKIWQIVSLEPWIIDFYGGRLPPELFSGQLTTIDFYFRTVELANQNLIYKNDEIIAVRMQYAENLPNMVYSIDTNKALTIYENQLLAAGYNEENTQKAVQTRKECLTYCAKAESIGISAEKIKPVLQKAETINVLEQFSTLSQQIENAKTPEEKKKALEQIQAFIKVNAEFLYNNSSKLDEICAKLPEINSKDDGKASPPPPPLSIPTKSSSEPTTKKDDGKASPPPPPLSIPAKSSSEPTTKKDDGKASPPPPPQALSANSFTQIKIQKADTKPMAKPNTLLMTENILEPMEKTDTLLKTENILEPMEKPDTLLKTENILEPMAKSTAEPDNAPATYSIYTHLNEQLDRYVDTRLKILDTSLSMYKKHHLQSTVADINSFESSKKKDLLKIKTESTNRLLTRLDTGKTKLADIIPAPKNMDDWCDSYLSKRYAQSREWGERMRNSAEEIRTARLNAKSVDEFSAALMQATEKHLQNIQQYYTHLNSFSR